MKTQFDFVLLFYQHVSFYFQYSFTLSHVQLCEGLCSAVITFQELAFDNLINVKNQGQSKLCVFPFDIISKRYGFST